MNEVLITVLLAFAAGCAAIAFFLMVWAVIAANDHSAPSEHHWWK